MTAQKITAKDIEKAISAGLSTYQTEARFGCGRVYVCISAYRDGNENDPAVEKENKRRTKATRSAVAKAAQSLGKRYRTNGFPVKHALYVGYDNNSGIELGQGTAIVKNLKALGVPAYRSEAAD